MQKKWYLSKTLWVALIAFVGTITAEIFGLEISAYWQGLALSVIMALMRVITKQPLNI